MAPSFFSIHFILLGALWSSVSAEAAGFLGKRAALLSPRQSCLNPSWIPVCPGALPCIPPGGICCSDSTYVMPPDTCSDGAVPVATAITSDVVSTTPAPVSTPPPVVEYTWYTWTITHYYYYYYYTYFVFSSELTSTERTYYTTVSLTATDEVEASSLIASLSATLSYNVPTQTGTPTYGSAPAATSTPAVTAYSTAPYPTSNATVLSSTPPVYFTGAAASLRAGAVSYFDSLFVLAAGAFMVIPGLLMLWL